MVDTTPRGSGPPAPRRSESTAARRAVRPEARDAAIERLSSAYARDLLPVEEFERRVALVYRASTTEALEGMTADLPAEAPVPAEAGSTAPAAPPGERITATFSSVERSGHAVIPAHLEIRTVLGNIELDLRNAAFEPGVTHIEVFNFLGNIEVKLPPDVAVENRGGAFLGSFAARAMAAAEGTAPPSSTVRITGRAVLGNVEFDGRGTNR